jgi:hypothetical protein
MEISMNALQPRVALGLALTALALAGVTARPTRPPQRRQDRGPGRRPDHRPDQGRARPRRRAGEADLERAGESIERGAEKIKPTLEKAGEKMKEAATGDPAITASIKASYLKDPDLSVFKIDVDTKDGVVTLNGVAGRLRRSSGR